MNYKDLTEEQFNRMAEELCRAWRTLGLGWFSDAERAAIQSCRRDIAKLLGQDPDEEPQWPPVRKFKVGLTQLRTVEYIAEVEVSAEDEVEAEELAFELARKDADHWTSRLDWEENGESTEHERRLDDGTWSCEPV